MRIPTPAAAAKSAHSATIVHWDVCYSTFVFLLDEYCSVSCWTVFLAVSAWEG